MEAQSTTYRTLISMFRVCKSRREAVISYPPLWNTIYSDGEMATRTRLERSKTLPLTVNLVNFSKWSTETLRLLGSHASRFEKLYL